VLQGGQSTRRARKGLLRIEGFAVIVGLSAGMILGLIAGFQSQPVEELQQATTPAVLRESSDATHTASLPPESVAQDRDAHDDELERLRQRVAELENARSRESRQLVEPETNPFAAAPPRQVQQIRDRRREDAKKRARTSARSSRGSPQSASLADMGRRTLDYWNSLNAIIAQEVALRTPPPNLTAANALEFVTARSRAGEFAAGSIRALSKTGVDPDVAAFAVELEHWYAEEASLGQNAGTLIRSSDIAARKGAAGNSWRGKEEAHRAKCDELNQRGVLLRQQMSDKYDLPFPELL